MKDSGKPSGFSRLLSVCLSVSHRVSVSHQNSTQLPSPNDNRLRIVTQKAFWMLSATNTTSISSQSYSYYYTINDLTRVGDLWLFYCPCNLYPYLINFSSILLCSALLTLPLCSAHSSTLLCSAHSSTLLYSAHSSTLLCSLFYSTLLTTLLTLLLYSAHSSNLHCSALLTLLLCSAHACSTHLES